MAGFYITLPSNASAAAFPNNKSSNFTIRLAKVLELPGSWEVGLVELQYPHTWNTLNAKEYFEIANERKKWHFPLKAGHYETIQKVIENMNKIMTEDKDPPEVTVKYDAIGRKIRLKCEGPYSILVTEGLGKILGLQPHVRTKKSNFVTDITGGFNTLYIYTDIVSPQIVGDFYVPLLRCLPVQGKDNEIITTTYDQPHYVTVNKHYIDTITVEIKTDQNENIAFNHGKVVVKLHFRPQKSEGWL